MLYRCHHHQRRLGRRVIAARINTPYSPSHLVNRHGGPAACQWLSGVTLPRNLHHVTLLQRLAARRLRTTCSDVSKSTNYSALLFVLVNVAPPAVRPHRHFLDSHCYSKTRGKCRISERGPQYLATGNPRAKLELAAEGICQNYDIAYFRPKIQMCMNIINFNE